MRIFWLTLGSLALALGTAGIFLPIMPTVPFYLLAAYGFSKSSSKFHNWMINHDYIGPHIRDWHENRVIKRRSKIIAALTMAGSVLLALLLGLPCPVVAVQASVLAAVAVFIWRQKEA